MANDGFYYTFAKAGGISRSFPVTSMPETFFKVGGVSKKFPATVSSPSFVNSGAISRAIPLTAINQSFLNVGAILTPFVVTPNLINPKLLQLKVGNITLNTDYTFAIVEDGTGIYDATTNPGGYNPVGDAPVPTRPYRTEVDLWIVYRIRHESTSPLTIYWPVSQYPQMDPFEYPLDLPKQGIYEIILIGAPAGTDYVASKQFGDAIFSYAQQAQDWYATSVGISINLDIVNCINKRRYEFLQGVMCGECTEDYLLLYSDYIGMLNALDLLDFPNAIILYNRIKTKCSEISCDCGC